MFVRNRGEEEEAERLTKDLAELEERADELSQKRSSTLSSISYINERNRKRNVERAEEAIMEELRASGGQKSEDPFTRRSTKTRMNHKPKDALPLPISELFAVQSNSVAAAAAADGVSKSSEPAAKKDTGAADKDKSSKVVKPKTGDLFSAHDFDIKIDLEVPLPCKCGFNFTSSNHSLVQFLLVPFYLNIYFY